MISRANNLPAPTRPRTTGTAEVFSSALPVHGPWWPFAGAIALAAALLLPSLAFAQTTNYVTSCDEGDFDAIVSGGGYIAFTNDCSITLSATISVLTNTIIDAQGHNVTLNGGNAVQLFSLASGAFTNIGLTLSGGTSAYGGAIFVNSSVTGCWINCTLSGSSASNGAGGAVYVSSNSLAVFTNCTLAGNSAVGPNGIDGSPGSTNNASGVGGNGGDGTAGSPGLGGAIYNLGSVTLQNCALTNNSTTGGTGGAGGAGGSQRNQGGNGGLGAAGAVGYGGAIYNLGNLTLTNCTLSGNSATAGSGGAGGAAGTGVFVGLAGSGGAGSAAGGGGICNFSNITVTACTFSANKVQGGSSAAGGNRVNGVGSPGPRGGDASGGGLFNGSTGQVVNCTFYTNTVTGGGGGNGGNGSGSLPTGGNGGDGGNGNGGGLDNAGSTLAVTNCTIANCSAVGGTNGVAGSGHFPGSPGNPGAANGGGIANIAGNFTLTSSLLSTNLLGRNAFGTITGGGYDLSSDATPSTLNSTNLSRTNLLLGPLANNGGPTMTMAILSTNSAAFGFVPTTNVPPPVTDQRSVTRPAPPKLNYYDAGAYELAIFPTIVTQPQSQYQTNGGSVTFSVLALGTSLKYQWRFNGTNVGVTTSSYTLNNVTATNAGNYDVVITNSFGSASKIISAVATLSIWPYIITQPTNQEIALGDSATFLVGVGGAPTNWIYQWLRNGTNPGAATGSSFTISNASTNDAGRYSVAIIPTNNSALSTTSAVATLTVDAILTQPASQTVAVGGSVRFSVVASGIGLQYQWRFNTTNNIFGAIGPNYSISSVAKSDAGVYDVVVYNSTVGSMRSAPATLTVTSPPVITNQPQSLVIAPGQNAVFAVAATGDNLGYQWNYQGLPLSGATSSSYTILNAQAAHSGNYSVTITNGVGSVTSATASLAVLSSPVVITNAGPSSNGFRIVFFGVSNVTYEILYTNRLGTLSNWPTATNYIGSNAPIRYTDPVTNLPGRFYRLKVP